MTPSLPATPSQRFLAYVRVSTKKQRDKGVSLKEQKAQILAYARRQDLVVTEWFTETKTAAKRGRPVFDQMVKAITCGAADGLLVHNVDRSSRNFHDWAAVSDLADRGIAVHFVRDGLALNNPSARLSADVQAVVAANHIRNNRLEAMKGITGRFREGILPRPAPIGYKNKGGGKPKVIHPLLGPKVKRAFELYASGEYSLHTLQPILNAEGLRNSQGRPVSINSLSTMLRNPFYVGIIRRKRTGETFAGRHEPLISSKLFDRVQRILDGRLAPRTKQHRFLFQRLFRCESCGYALISEKQKGNVYYRCHTPTCPTTSLREDVLQAEVDRTLVSLTLPRTFEAVLREKIQALGSESRAAEQRELTEVRLALGKVEQRLSRLADLLLDGSVEVDLFAAKKEELLRERARLRERMTAVETHDSNVVQERVGKFLELAKSASLRFKSNPFDEKRRILAEATSNRTVRGKSVSVKLSEELQVVADASAVLRGAPHHGDARMAEAVLRRLLQITPSAAPDDSLESPRARARAEAALARMKSRVPTQQPRPLRPDGRKGGSEEELGRTAPDSPRG